MWFHLYVILIAFNLFYLIICFVFKYLTTKYSSQVQSKWRSNQENPKSTQAVSSTLLCQRPAAACAHMVNNLTHCLENTPAQFLRKHFTAAIQFQSQLVSGLSGWLVDWSFSRKPCIFSAGFGTPDPEKWVRSVLVFKSSYPQPSLRFFKIKFHESVQCFIRFQVHGSCG